MGNRPIYRTWFWWMVLISASLVLILCMVVSPAVAPQVNSMPTLSSATDPPFLSDPSARWIEVSLREQKVRLHDGFQIVGEYLAATGVGDRPEYTTYTGIFTVHRQYKGPVESAPGVFVMNVLEFDPEHGNGIHSLPMGKDGNILDSQLGKPITAGCVRVAESAAIYAFASLGMIVWVH